MQVCARGSGRPPVAKSAVLRRLFHTEEETCVRACVRTYVRATYVRACVRTCRPSVPSVRVYVSLSLCLSLFFFLSLPPPPLSVHVCARVRAPPSQRDRHTGEFSAVYLRTRTSESRDRSTDRPTLFFFHDLYGNSAMRGEAGESGQRAVGRAANSDS